MISNRDIRRQMTRLKRRSGLYSLRKWLELEREAINRGLAEAQECSCCMERWRTPGEWREWRAMVAEIRRDNAARGYGVTE